MKSFKNTLSILSLFSIILFSMLIISCSENDPQNETENMEVSEDILEDGKFIVVPDGLTGEEAANWALSQPEDKFETLEKESDDTILESRWCHTYDHEDTHYVNTNGCWCEPYPNYGYGWYCTKQCRRTYLRTCGGYSGGRYVVRTWRVFTSCFVKSTNV